MSLDWIKELGDVSDLLDKDSALIANHCGMDTLLSLWEKLPSITLYISAKPLQAAQKRYIRAHFEPGNAKQLAALLGVSERFVYEAVQTTEPANDPRQGKLL